jgi:hypothetical protein
MARPILSEFGPERSTGPASISGGVTEAKPLPYSPPTGPTNLGDRGPGLHGTVHKSGSQGSYGHCDTSGSPGIGGDKHPGGSQR